MVRTREGKTLLALLLLCAMLLVWRTGSASGEFPRGVTMGTTATEVILDVTADATVDSTVPGTPRGRDEWLYTGYGGSEEPDTVFRLLVRFDLRPLPSNAIIDSARLELYGAMAVGPWVPPDPVLVTYRVAADWSETNVRWNNQPPVAETAGGLEVGVDTMYYAWDVTAMARAWQSGPNYGLELRGPENDMRYLRGFHSREKGQYPPRLVVNYHLPGQQTPTPSPTQPSATGTPTASPTQPGPTRTATPTQMPEQGQNLLENPGFEYQLQGWSVSSGSATYAADWQVYKSGRYSARGVEYTTGSLGRLYQDVTAKVVPGRLYKISGWIKTEGVSGAAVIGLDYVAPGGWTPVGGYIREIGSVQGSQDWTYHESAPFVVPPWHTDASALWFLFDFNAGRGTAYWDDVALVPVSRVYLPVMVRTSGG